MRRSTVMWNVFWVIYDTGINTCKRIIMSEFIDVKEIFGENVFNDSAMKARLPKKVYQEQENHGGGQGIRPCNC